MASALRQFGPALPRRPLASAKQAEGPSPPCDWCCGHRLQNRQGAGWSSHELKDHLGLIGPDHLNSRSSRNLDQSMRKLQQVCTQPAANDAICKGIVRRTTSTVVGWLRRIFLELTFWGFLINGSTCVVQVSLSVQLEGTRCAYN